MNYQLEGHPHRHAVEEMLLHLLPDRTVSEGVDDGGDFCQSILFEEQSGVLSAAARVRLDGVQREGERKGLLTPGQDSLARKRLENELLKLAIYDAVAPALAEPPVWGALTGVRPAKLARGLMERGASPQETEEHLCTRFQVSPERAALTMAAAAYAQETDRKIVQNSISVYVSIPFCPTRCAYCSFISAAVEQNAQFVAPYLEALCKEAEETGRLVRQNKCTVDSLYIGGGTPTTLSSEQLDKLLSVLERSFDLSNLFDYTVEAGRPDTITAEKLAVLRAHGVTRVSVNPQSMNDEVLRLAGRPHTARDVLESFEMARKAGFPVINMDVIAGLEGDTPARFAETINTLLGLGPENITVHTLAVKRGAAIRDIHANLARRCAVGHMLSYAQRALLRQDYHAYYLYRQKFSAGGYENTGWCKTGTESFYNISMMEELQTIISLGAGGVSKRVNRATGKIERYTNPKYPAEYLQAQERILRGRQRLLQE